MNWQQRERALQRQLELTREERSEAESLQATEQREAESLKERLYTATDEQQHTQDLLREARRELKEKAKEAAASRAALNRYLGLADNLQAAAGEVVQRASRAKHEAEVARRKSKQIKMKAKRDLAAATAAVAEANEVAEESA